MSRVLFPIVIDKEVTCILDTYGHQCTADTEKLINGFIRIYSNYLSILHDNEHDTLTGLLNRKSFDRRLIDVIEDKQSERHYVVPREMERRINVVNTVAYII